MSVRSKKYKFLLVLIPAILVLGLGYFILRGKGPRKPGDIPPSDYSYTLEYSTYRVRDLMEKKHLPSLAIALVDDQDTIWLESFGSANLEGNIPAESNTVYKLWSVSKVFTAIEIMRLVEGHLVELDAPITTYLPDFSVQSRFPDSESITIRKILTHRAGLPRNGCHWLDFSLNALPALVTSLEDCYLAYPVGYRYKYSNIGFDTLGDIVQEIRGMPFTDTMRENLLLPIGMADSAFLRSQVPAQLDVAYGYEFYKGEYYPYEQNDITSFPSGNLYGTIEDMGKFVKFIFRGGEANGEQIINAETLELMFGGQASSARDPQPMGLGWKTASVLGSERLAWHDGGPSEGIGSLVALLPERKLGVVLIANGTSFDGSVSTLLALDILELMLETKFGVTAPADEPQAKAGIESAVFESYTGRYVAFGEVMDVFLKGDQLKASIQGFTFNLDPLGETTFQPRHWLADIGLASLLGVPIDLRQLKIEFMPADGISDDIMIINISGISYEVCPRYPDIEAIPPHWEKLIGEYEIFARLPSGALGKNSLGNATIWVEDNILQMGGDVGPLLPISETESIILSGPFAGETMIYQPDTGNLYHQKIVFVKK